jgi:hypothetical protein
MPIGDDFSDDVGTNRWTPPEGWVDIEIVKMVAGTSKSNNPKYTIDVVSALDAGEGMQIDLTNIPGKRWLLRQLIEAVGIESRIEIEEFTQKEKKVYDWEVEDIEGRTVSAKVVHEPNKWTDRNNVVHDDVKAKIVSFRNLTA